MPIKMDGRRSFFHLKTQTIMPSFHGNDKRNDKPHHLYEIKDKQENDTFKFGISCDPINKEKDGLSDSRPSGLGEFDS